jgi:hypothetical protein
MIGSDAPVIQFSVLELTAKLSTGKLRVRKKEIIKERSVIRKL